MASFAAELIRASMVGGSILGASLVGYKYYQDEKVAAPAVQHIRDKNLVGVRITGLDPGAVQKIRHQTECLERDGKYKKILETDTEVLFTTAKPVSKFADDCKLCDAGSRIYYAAGEDYMSWTP